jgi:hypothetical protein
MRQRGNYISILKLVEMTLQELHIKLKELEVPEDRYYMHGLYGSTNDDDKLALTIRKDVYTVEYETYYKERGEKHSVKIFTTCFPATSPKRCC